MKKLGLILCIAFAFNLFVKSIAIRTTPPLLTDDEMYYATESESLLKGGTDITGTWKPWQLRPANPIYAELTGLTYAPGFILFPHNAQVAMKVVPILFGSLLPLLIALIVYRFFPDQSALIITLIIATCNPWIFQFSRMSFDSFASVFFYMLGVVMILYLPARRVFLAFLPFTFGFFQYQGHKPILLPLVFLTILTVVWKEAKVVRVRTFPRLLWKNYRPHLALFGMLCLLVGAYLWRIHTLPSNRVGEIQINETTLAEQVNTDRRLTIANPFSHVFTNKFIQQGETYLLRFFSSFDVSWLFFQGNSKVDTFAVSAYGFLYPLDAILILIAVVYLWSSPKRYRVATFCMLFVLIGVIPNVLKNDTAWLTFRSAFMVMGLILLSSIGGWTIWRWGGKGLKAMLVLLFLATVTPFFYHYFFRYPVLASENRSFYSRVIASYIARQKERSFTLFTTTQVFDSILVYNSLIQKDTLPTLHTAYQNKKFKLGNIDVAVGCLTPAWAATQSATFIVDYKTTLCEGSSGPSIATPSGKIATISIGSLTDSLSQYYVYNDHLCNQYPLEQYLTMKDNKFSLESLSDQEFCTTFFSHPGKEIQTKQSTK